jgi:hypothetical protein
MPEFAFIEALSAYLRAPARLIPEPVQIGPAEPTGADEAPAVVLSLETVRRLRGGLGEGADAVTGVLRQTARIDLAAPFLPAEPGFNLVTADRLTLTLPHGGLIRADGLDGALTPADLAVTVAETPRTLAAANPAPDEFTAAPLIGRLTFGAPLPAADFVEATYHLGAWERRVFLIAGDLAVTSYAAAGGQAATLSAAVARALARPGDLAGLKRLSLVSLGPVTPSDATHGNTRAQTAHYAFEYEHVVDTPASSGGIIQTTPITTRLRLLRRDRASGTVVEDTITDRVRGDAP